MKKAFLTIFCLTIILTTKVCSQETWIQVTELDRSAITLCSDKNNNLYSSTREFLYKSSDYGESWQPIYTLLTIEDVINSVARDKDNNLIIAAWKTGIYKSTDEGENWTNIGLGDQNVNEVEVLSNGNIIAATQTGIFLTLDNGNNWENVSKILTPNTWWNTTTHTMYITSDDIIYTGTQCGLFMSENYGSDWKQLNTDCGDVKGIALNNEGHIYITGGNTFKGIFKSTDKGETFTKISDLELDSKSIVVSQKNKIFATSINKFSLGLYSPKDNDENWELYDFESFATHNMVMLDNGLIFLNAAKYNFFPGTGMWLSEKTKIYKYTQDVTGIEEVYSLNNDFQLKQNYPNPFNPSTTIGFTTTSNSKINLKIFSVLGEIVEDVNFYDLTQGYHEYKFNGANLSSGTYFYTLTGNNQSMTNKMILMK